MLWHAFSRIFSTLLTLTQVGCVDKRGDRGFIPDENQYRQKRMPLQIELGELKPAPNEELKLAVNC